MKKNIILALCASILLFSCNNSKNKKEQISCNESPSAVCEFKKPWSLVKVVLLRNDDCVDAFGQRIKVGEYYLLNKRTQMLFKIGYRPESYHTDVTPVNLSLIGKPSNKDNNCLVLRNAKLDTIRISLSGYYALDCSFVCLPNSEFTVQDRNTPQWVDVINYK